jgi:hypothetical protein
MARGTPVTIGAEAPWREWLDECQRAGAAAGAAPVEHAGTLTAEGLGGSA